MIVGRKRRKIMRTPSLDRQPGLRAIFLSTAAAACSHAAVILDSNLDGTLNSNVTGSNGKAVGFTLGSGTALGAEAYRLESIVVRLETGASAPSVENYSFRLYANDSSLSPGTQLAQFTSMTLSPNTTVNQTLLLDTPFLLQPSTTYWLVATATTGNTFSWKYGGGTATTTAAGVSVSSPASYFGNSADPSAWTSTSPNFTDLQINAVAVPEAGVLAFAALAVPLALRRRVSLRS